MPGVLQSMGSERVGQDLATERHLFILLTPPFAFPSRHPICFIVSFSLCSCQPF